MLVVEDARCVQSYIGYFRSSCLQMYGCHELQPGSVACRHLINTYWAVKRTGQYVRNSLESGEVLSGNRNHCPPALLPTALY